MVSTAICSKDTDNGQHQQVEPLQAEYKETNTKAVGKDAHIKQACFNLLLFNQPHGKMPMADITVYTGKEKLMNNRHEQVRNNDPNFSINKEVPNECDITVERDYGIWINDGDSNVPSIAKFKEAGQTEA